MGRNVTYTCDGDECERLAYPPIVGAVTGNAAYGLIVDTTEFHSIQDDSVGNMRRLYFCSNFCAAKHFATNALPG